MKIREDLKNSLLVDIEHICDINLDKDTKESLKRAIEITIASNLPVLNIEGNPSEYMQGYKDGWRDCHKDAAEND